MQELEEEAKRLEEEAKKLPDARLDSAEDQQVDISDQEEPPLREQNPEGKPTEEEEKKNDDQILIKKEIQ